ncbi:Glycerol 2-dehydrogenase (NADP(+)) [Pseudocercospora fuligena]|uniref:Glycerol 2-dehydrogenase (NADP(+)) n=1 Tax=Pseudocercospora fuligena TaxID=685502 RepID=A0A8H6RPN2_9PEZI|nr:Glycerol 2-dehydrogenase (NADP(+)) [Pseudocercospora fuligena]
MAAAKITEKKYQLNSGYEIPAIGLGTWQSGPNEVATAVEAALKLGYRHIDTAAAYGNEAEVGAGIKASGVPRNEIFLTTKLKESDLHRAAAALDESLEKLGTAYIDLYLVHWPCPVSPNDAKKAQPGWDIVKTWSEMQKLPATGKVRSIGVSNFGKNHLEQLFNAPDFSIVPAVNQVEIHPCYPSGKLLAYNTSKKIHTTAYSCLGSTDSPLYKNDALKKIADAKGKTVQQVLLRWGLNRGYSVIPKSVTPKRIQANFDLDGWDLTADEAKAIDAIPDRFKVCDGTFLPNDGKDAALFQDDE